MVRDEAGNFSPAISVYSGQGVEAFVPDITSPGWVYWHKGEWSRAGTYSVYVYSHYQKNFWCRPENVPTKNPEWLKGCALIRYIRHYIAVDTRKKTVTVMETIFMEDDAKYNPLNQWAAQHDTYSLTGNLPLQKEVARISAIIKKEMEP